MKRKEITSLASPLQRRKSMSREIANLIVLGSFALGAWLQAYPQDAKAHYSSIAPINQYIMADRNAAYLNPQFNGAPEPIEVFVVLTGMWLDGTLAPSQLRTHECRGAQTTRSCHTGSN